MPVNWRMLCGLLIGLSGCAGFPSAPAPEPAPVPGREAREALSAFPATEGLSGQLATRWLDTAGSRYVAFEAAETLRAELNRNAAARKDLGAAMTELVNTAWNGGPRPDSLDADLDPATLVKIHDPALVLRLIAPALAEGGDLHNALVEGDPELPRFLENLGAGEDDPGFSLYLETIDDEGMDSPVSQALLHRMFYVRPTRAMDLMLDRNAGALSDPMPLFGVQQAVRLRLTRERLGEISPRETLSWMTGVLGPLQGHEQWWVRYYARRLLELQVRKASGGSG